MSTALALQSLLLPVVLLCADLTTLVPDEAVLSAAAANTETRSEYFEGRWAFAEETCDQPTNWTLLAGGNFVSEDLIGRWQWAENILTLSLTDLAIDEETDEVGGKFQMQGPVIIASANKFSLVIAPETYEMKRCD